VAHDPDFRQELDAIGALEGDAANAAEVRTRLDALADRMRAQVEANIQRQVDAARAALGRVGVGATGPEGGCLARTGDLQTATESGWADLNSPGITQATEQVLHIGHEMGYEFPPHEFDDGLEGHFYASHAEKQLNALRPGEPIGVSLPMCSDCYNYFRSRANAMGRPLVVADPLVTRIFYPNGSVLTPARTVAPMATGPANQSPGPPSGPR
jgi:predicted 2-oxoglutarate/Fe(II)-dependent dioxygenase YbiX